jgi:phage terminase large subunit
MSTPSSVLSGSTSRTSNLVQYQPFGNALAIFTDKSPELALSGPAGTGKSLACLYKLHALALKYPGMRGGIVRRTRASLTQSALVTFDKKVQPQRWGVRFHHQDQEYQYPNGSVIVVGGLVPDVGKVMSTEYDIVYGQEATELEQGEAEALTTRLRNGVLPYQQLLMDCNPDAPTHWLKRRADSGATRMLESRHEDNPTLWDRARGEWTPAGAAYIAKLDALTGVRKLRLRYGIWAAAEGMVYEGWDRAVHLVDRSQIPGLVDGEFPGVWPRDWSIDFGYTNPFVWQQWVEDPDGRLYLEREIYRTQRLVEDHARDILRAAGGVRPRRIVCDHDAEDRATLERHIGMPTEGAYKAVSPGIQAVAARLRTAGDGKPRLFLLRDALVERDPALDESKRPASTAEEWDGYVWDTANGRRTGEAPVKKDDHGMDALRFVVATVDRLEDGRTGETGSFDYRRGRWVG